MIIIAFILFLIGLIPLLGWIQYFTIFACIISTLTKGNRENVNNTAEVMIFILAILRLMLGGFIL